MPENKTTVDLPTDRKSAPDAPKTPDQQKREATQVSQEEILRRAQTAPSPATQPNPSLPNAPPKPTPAQAAATTPPSQNFLPDLPQKAMELMPPPSGPSKDAPGAEAQMPSQREAGGPVGTGPLVQETRPQVSMPDDPEQAAKNLEKKAVLPSQVQVSQAEAQAEEDARIRASGVQQNQLPQASREQAFAAPAGVQQKVQGS